MPVYGVTWQWDCGKNENSLLRRATQCSANSIYTDHYDAMILADCNDEGRYFMKSGQYFW
jgi:hypothetical protein